MPLTWNIPAEPTTGPRSAAPGLAAPPPDDDAYPDRLDAESYESDGDQTEGVPVDEFWQARPVLAYVRELAYSRLVAPWALFGNLVLRVLAQVPYTVVLPPLIGGDGSLNTIVALVGASGTGKGASSAAARDAITWTGNTSTVPEVPLGTGEGITSTYARIITDKEQTDDSRPGDLVWLTRTAIFTAPEVDGLNSRAARRGATLMATLRLAWSGEPLGSAIQNRDQRVLLPAHSYRFVAAIGVQPKGGQVLLDDADGGTPQRVLWLPATDPGIPDTPPERPAPWKIRLPSWGDLPHTSAGRNLFQVDAEVARQIIAAHVSRQRGEGDALDGHAMFTREKVAAVLAILDERVSVSLADWNLAGLIMHVSDRTRAAIQWHTDAKRRQAAEARKHERAAEAIYTDDEKHAHGIVTMQARIVRYLAGIPERSLAFSLLRKHLHPKGEAKAILTEALDGLIADGCLTLEDGRNGGRVYRLTTRGQSSQ